MDKKSNREKGEIAVIILGVAFFLVVVVVTIAIVGAVKENGSFKKSENTSLYSLAGVTNATTQNSLNEYFESEETQETVSTIVTEVVQSEFIDDFIDVEAGDEQIQTTQKEETSEYNPLEEYEKLSKNGENQLSDHHNNKYIKLISEKFTVDKNLLVAIYSEPDTGNNFVLEFSGKKNEDGNVIKSPDTLVKVYSIDKELNVCVATGKVSGNVGVSYAEGILCFNMIKVIVMPQYPEYFSGVEK